MRVSVGFRLGLVFSLLSLSSYSQSLPVGTPVLEQAWRRRQIKGEEDANSSFAIRPLYNETLRESDTLKKRADSLYTLYQGPAVFFAKGKGMARLLPLELKQQYNSHHPYGWNDGPMIPAKGYQNQFSFGAYSQIGPLQIQLRPDLVYAQNQPFAPFPPNRNAKLSSYYYSMVLNYIDEPEAFGKGSYTHLFPGQSSVRINYRKLSLGVSTENLWWGPGIRNSLLMSNTAPGFPHITFNSAAPIVSPIGLFEWQVIGGTLKGSGIVPQDTSITYNGVKLYQPKRREDRYINGMIATWQPKWTKGLYLGFTRVFYLYNSNVSSSFDGYLPVIGSIFKKNTKNEDAKSRDQMLSAFFRLILPKEKAEVYGELGRNDHSSDSRDFFLEPEHSSAYIIGLRKLFDLSRKQELELMTEFTNLQVPMTILLREQSSWYSHYQVRHGYTNRGQVIGAGIGSGGRSQTIGLSWVKGIKELGLSFERVVRNNDFYYAAFTPTRNFSSHWVDLSLNLNASYPHKRFIYSVNVSRVKSLNYHWQQYNDVKNLHAQLTASYLF